jgi:hypothetical protein
VLELRDELADARLRQLEPIRVRPK